ncbi:uncharacterized protein HGUI_01209 [Hanseniaspora guilliermondii]|uniref:GDP/GTP exchange factor Sec2 N-terminal domain-containing protein n=1 Tax=Hanseniaspora guilliermondii TaxID=56406 RepID=A0A1L0CKT7_9ASCO|nr:uncharacterized protein HGUI_01209 [Hanseniaspora guilliermondii]
MSELNTISKQQSNSQESFITVEEKNRIESSLSDMSQQLMETMNKNQLLEEKLIKLQEDIEYKKLQKAYEEQQLLREKAEQEVKGLREEISDLSVSLFEEANKMVSVEKENVYKKDLELKQIQRQLKEKEDIEVNLSQQLNSLKTILQQDSKAIEKTGDDTTNKNNTIHDQRVLFSPSIKNIRFDTEFYQEYLRFVSLLSSSNSILDTKHGSKLLKIIINQDIEPILKLDNSKSLTWAHKKNLFNWFISGEVLVEPISGHNEHFKSSYINKGKNMYKFPDSSPPVAIDEPCSICNERRNDSLEHNRLHYMKLPSQSSKKEFNLYLLCHYCLLKVRSICDIFGFLRELKMGVWNLEKVSSSSIDVKEQPLSQSTTRRKRSSSRAAKRVSMISDAFNIWSMNSNIDDSTKGNDKSDMVIETSKNGDLLTNIQLSFIELCKLRSILNWTNLGIWSLDTNDNACMNTKISPILDIDDKTVDKDTIKQIIKEESLKETSESIQEISIKDTSPSNNTNISEIDNAVDNILENVGIDEEGEEEQSGFDFEEYESSLPTSPV